MKKLSSRKFSERELHWPRFVTRGKRFSLSVYASRARMCVCFRYIIQNFFFFFFPLIRCLRRYHTVYIYIYVCVPPFFESRMGMRVERKANKQQEGEQGWTLLYRIYMYMLGKSAKVNDFEIFKKRKKEKKK